MEKMLLKLFFTLFCLVNLIYGDSGNPTFSQPLGIAGNFLITTVGVGSPPQYLDLGIILSTDKSVFVDSTTQNADLDYSYDYVKQTFAPEISDTLNITNQVCRARYVNSAGYIYTADGQYVDDFITLGGLIFESGVRFCDLNKTRTATTTSDDPLNWLMNIPIDGILGLKPGGENIFQKIGFNLGQISLYANSKASEPDNSGVVTFGGQDTKNCKNFLKFPSEDSDSWTIWVTKATYNAKDVTGTYSTLLDLSTENLVVPKEILTAISAYFGGVTNYIYCSSYPSPPDLQLNIYGTNYNIPIKQYLQKMAGQSYYCQLNIDTSTSSDENQIILGRNILDNYCLFLDYDRSEIGLANVKTN